MAEPQPQPEGPSGDEVRYLPVKREAPLEAATARPIEPARPVSVPAAVAAATSGFLAGVATFVLVRVLRQRRSRRALGRALSRRGRGDRLEIAGSRSFLVDIHLLRR